MLLKAAIGLIGILQASNASAQQVETWVLSPDAVVLGRGADELFESVRSGKLLRDGGAVVADAGGMFVRSYDRAGARSWTFGRTGDGPGEFRAMSGVWETPNGSVGVWDGHSRRLTTIDRSGALAATARVATTALLGNLELFFGTYENGDVLLGSLHLPRAPRHGEIVAETWHLARFSPGGELLSRLGHVAGMQRMYRAPLPFSPVSWIALRRDSLLVVEGYQDALQVTSGAAATRRRIALPLRDADARTAQAELERELQQRNRSFFLDLLEEAPRVEQLPRVGGLLVDTDGRAWVKEYDPARDAIWLKRNALETAPGGTWHLLDSRGSLVATIRAPDGFVPLDVADGRVLGVEHDEFDVQRAVVRRILLVPESS